MEKESTVYNYTADVTVKKENKIETYVFNNQISIPSDYRVYHIYNTVFHSALVFTEMTLADNENILSITIKSIKKEKEKHTC